MEEGYGHKPLVLQAKRQAGYRGEYLETSLAPDVRAFFFISCGNSSRSCTIVPLNPDERLFIINDHNDFPVQLENIVIKLRSRGIWVVQTPFRAAKQINTINPKPQRINTFVRLTPVKRHCSPFLRSLPNSSHDRYQTFDAHRDTSVLCRLLLCHPQQIRRYVAEGVFYTGYADLHVPGGVCSNTPKGGIAGGVQKPEQVSCSFCKKSTVFDAQQVVMHLAAQPEVESSCLAAENYLAHRNLHQVRCPWRNYQDQALVQVKDPEGHDKLTQMYFLSDPALESASVKPEFQFNVCPYIRVFVMDTGYGSNPLIVLDEEMAEIVHQLLDSDLGKQIWGAVNTVSEALGGLDHVLGESLTGYRQQYSSSALGRTTQTYVDLLKSLPAPLTVKQEAILVFLEKTNSKFCRLYTVYHQLNHLLPWVKKANPILLDALNPIIHRLALEHREIVDSLVVCGNVSLSSGSYAMHISKLATLFPDEWPWGEDADPRHREIVGLGNEILAQLQLLYLQDNDQYVTALRGYSIAIATGKETTQAIQKSPNPDDSQKTQSTSQESLNIENANPE